jgi:hypothetical protein
MAAITGSQALELHRYGWPHLSLVVLFQRGFKASLHVRLQFLGLVVLRSELKAKDNAELVFATLSLRDDLPVFVVETIGRTNWRRWSDYGRCNCSRIGLA